MEEGSHEIPMWKGNFTLEYVADCIPCKSENQSAYPCIEWVDRCLTEMDIGDLGRKTYSLFMP